MSKSNTVNGTDRQGMSKAEQRIYFALANDGNKLFDIGLIRSYGLCGEGMLKQTLASMVKKGWLVRIKKGMYTLDKSADPFKIGPYVFGGYVAFSSALYVYGVFDEMPSVVYVANIGISSKKRIGNIEIQGVALHRRAVGFVAYMGYTVSSKAKTLYDCFYMPENAGGYSKVLRAISMLKLEAGDWKEFLSYVRTFGSPSFMRRVGYMLESLNGIGRFVPRYVITGLNRKGGVARLGSGRHGAYIRKWNIVDYVGMETLLGF